MAKQEKNNAKFNILHKTKRQLICVVIWEFKNSLFKRKIRRKKSFFEVLYFFFYCILQLDTILLGGGISPTNIITPPLGRAPPFNYKF